MSIDNIARILAIVLALVMAFVAVPYGGLGLVVLGLVIGFMGVPEERRMMFLVLTVALTASAGALGGIPAVGGYLSSFFSNAAAVLQAGTLAVFLMIAKDRITE